MKQFLASLMALVALVGAAVADEGTCYQRKDDPAWTATIQLGAKIKWKRGDGSVLQLDTLSAGTGREPQDAIDDDGNIIPFMFISDTSFVLGGAVYEAGCK